jgi:phosphonopyruvate decarboxylase
MIDARDFVDAATRHGYSLWTGVPCSYLKSFINFVIGNRELRYVSAANEGDAVAIATGAELGGMGAIVMLQNSGLGNAVSPLTSLNAVFRLPVLLIISQRGDPDDVPDEPQHELMGTIATRMLEVMGIAWEYFPTDTAAIESTLERVRAHMATRSHCYALVMRRGSVGDWPAPALQTEVAPMPPTVDAPPPAAFRRHQFLRRIQELSVDRDLVVATTGYTGRELYALADRSNQFYMVGSMGCASSFALGLALARPQRRIIVLDGDGAALMRLGAFAAIGQTGPTNLIHFVFANGAHESTGGQAVAAPAANFAAIAAALGYRRVDFVSDPAQLDALLAGPSIGPRLVHVPVLPGSLPNLPRPRITPPEIAMRLRAMLNAS